jgi:hypothetical protein
MSSSSTVFRETEFGVSDRVLDAFLALPRHTPSAAAHFARHASERLSPLQRVLVPLPRPLQTAARLLAFERLTILGRLQAQLERVAESTGVGAIVADSASASAEVVAVGFSH